MTDTLKWHAAIHKKTGEHHFVADLGGICLETYELVPLDCEPTEHHRFDGEKLVYDPRDSIDAMLDRMTRKELVDYILAQVK